VAKKHPYPASEIKFLKPSPDLKVNKKIRNLKIIRRLTLNIAILMIKVPKSKEKKI